MIDSNGKQVGDIYTGSQQNEFYKLPTHGYDHSAKNYFLSTSSSQSGVSLTGEQISLVSGQMCVTYSQRFEVFQKYYILCFNYLSEDQSHQTHIFEVAQESNTEN
jgi:hypothetical protein